MRPLAYTRNAVAIIASLKPISLRDKLGWEQSVDAFDVQLQQTTSPEDEIHVQTRNKRDNTDCVYLIMYDAHGYFSVWFTAPIRISITAPAGFVLLALDVTKSETSPLDLKLIPHPEIF